MFAASSVKPRITRFSSTLDTWRRYLTDSPSPSNIARILRDVDAGDVAAMVELNEEIEAKDAHLQGVASRRREAVTALDWEIVPDTTTQDTKAATETAEYAQRRLENLASWPTTLEHLETAIGPGVAVSEMIWQEGELDQTIDVPGHRLDSNPTEGSDIRVITDDHLVDGIKAYSPGFIVHLPNMRAGFPLRVTITRANAYLWVLKHFVIADWSSFSETYGQPIRVGTYEEGVATGDREQVEDMLKHMAADCWALFPQGVKVELLEAARANQPYEAMVDWIERKQSILWLGQTLTTEQGAIGSLALGQVHDNVRASITLSDLKAEARMIREQVLRPMIRFRWPGKDMPVPHFKRAIVEETNIEADRLMLEKLRYMQETGRSVDDDWVYESLGIPQPKQTKESEE